MQINPRVSTQFTGHGSRVLHALEAQTGKSFLFEGSEGLALDHFAITFMGTREEVEERALPFRQGDEVLVEIVEPHMYDVDDAVAKIDGYIISIAGAAAARGREADGAHRPGRAHGGERAAARRVRRGRRSAARRAERARGGAALAGLGATARAAKAAAAVAAAACRRPTARTPRRGCEAGLSESPTAIDSEPEQEPRRAPPAPMPTRPQGEGARGWPTIQASASWPQGRTAPFGCQGQGDPRVGRPARRRIRPARALTS